MFRRHAQADENSDADKKRRASVPITEFIAHPLSDKEKSDITDILARYVIEGNVSFRHLEQPSFVRAAISLLNLGARRKKPAEDTNLVERRAISRRLTVHGESAFEKVKVSVPNDLNISLS